MRTCAFPGGPPVPGIAVTRGQRPGGTLALLPFNAGAADRALGYEHDWRPIAATLRGGLIAAVAR
jgi:hypothetical protein